MAMLRLLLATLAQVRYYFLLYTSMQACSCLEDGAAEAVVKRVDDADARKQSVGTEEALQLVAQMESGVRT